jgi:hypothetical protein
MTSHSDIDRAIDAAAAAMMTREPGRSLNSAVMARVREGEGARSSSRTFVWTAAAAVIVCAAIAAALMYGAPLHMPALPQAHTLATAPPASTVAAPSMVADVAMSVRRRAAAVESVMPRVALPPADMPRMVFLDADSIAVAEIELPPLEPDSSASMEVLNIDQLTIEPLSASND